MTELINYKTKIKQNEKVITYINIIHYNISL